MSRLAPSLLTSSSCSKQPVLDRNVKYSMWHLHMKDRWIDVAPRFLGCPFDHLASQWDPYRASLSLSWNSSFHSKEERIWAVWVQCVQPLQFSHWEMQFLWIEQRSQRTDLAWQFAQSLRSQHETESPQPPVLLTSNLSFGSQKVSRAVVHPPALEWSRLEWLHTCIALVGYPRWSECGLSTRRTLARLGFYLNRA